MVALAAGAVVLVRFPFSDLSLTKLRPAVILANAGRGDWILCQITSKQYGDSRAVQIENSSFSEGALHLTSYARPGRLFTGSRDLIAATVGTLKSDSFVGIVDAVVALLRAAP